MAIDPVFEPAYSAAMTKLNIRTLATAAGITNPLVFSKQSGLAYAMCYKLWNDQQTRIDLTTIDRLCEVLRCLPGDLFVREASDVAEKAGAQVVAADVGRLSAGGHAPVAGSRCRRIRWID